MVTFEHPEGKTALDAALSRAPSGAIRVVRWLSCTKGLVAELTDSGRALLLAAAGVTLHPKPPPHASYRAAAAQQAAGRQLSPADAAVASNRFRRAVRADLAAGASSFAGSADASVAKLVNLAFHDAATFSAADGEGGADGCVDVRLEHNRGLEGVLQMVERARLAHGPPTLSRADAIVLAAIVALAHSGGPTVPFWHGRVDAPCEAEPARFPTAEPQGRSAISEVEESLVVRLGLSPKEAVALMAAHGLGRASLAISGYTGAWTAPSERARFGSHFYARMLDQRWSRRQRYVGDGPADVRTSWVRPQLKAKLLNTDVALAFDLDGGACDQIGGRVNMTLDTSRVCPPRDDDFGAAARLFARDERALLDTFASAFEKLSTRGWAGLQLEPGPEQPHADALPSALRVWPATLVAALLLVAAARLLSRFGAAPCTRTGLPSGQALPESLGKLFPPKPGPIHVEEDEVLVTATSCRRGSLGGSTASRRRESVSAPDDGTSPTALLSPTRDGAHVVPLASPGGRLCAK